MNERTYTVTGMSCEHCAQTVTSEVSAVPGVTEVDVDLASGRVLVVGDQPVDDESVRAAVAEAGYEIAS